MASSSALVQHKTRCQIYAYFDACKDQQASPKMHLIQSSAETYIQFAKDLRRQIPELPQDDDDSNDLLISVWNSLQGKWSRIRSNDDVWQLLGGQSAQRLRVRLPAKADEKEVKLVLQKRLREAEQQLQRLARKAEAKFEAHRAACRRAEKQSKAIKVDVDVDHQRRATQEEDDEWTVIENSEELRRSTMEMLRQEMLLCVPDQTLKTKLMATVAKLRERLDKSTAAEFYLSDDSD